jgi:hypothetical protein
MGHLAAQLQTTFLSLFISSAISWFTAQPTTAQGGIGPMSESYSEQRGRPGYKRSRSRSPSWLPSQKTSRKHDGQDGSPYRERHDNFGSRNSYPSRGGQSFRGRHRHHQDTQEQMRLNQLQEEEQARQWVAQEDSFVLTQAKKKAEIRVKEGRAKPIDWLAVTLRAIDPTRNLLDDEMSDADLDLIDPIGVLEGLSKAKLPDLEKDIDTFLNLETAQKNRDFWEVRYSFNTLSDLYPVSAPQFRDERR